jgi:adenylate cyclase
MNLFKKEFYLNNRFIRTVCGVLIALFFIAQAGNWIHSSLIEHADGLLYDVRLKLTAPGGVDSRIVIVDIDESSLREREQGGEGRWPWPRDRLALLNDRLLNQYQVALIAYDVIFSEKDLSSGIKSLENIANKNLGKNSALASELSKIKPELDFDGRFAASMKDQPVVLGYTFLPAIDSARKGTLPTPALTTKELPLSAVDPSVRSGYTANLARLQASAADGGHVNPLIDSDGVIRRVPMLIRHEDGYYESLALASARTILGGLPLGLILTPGSTVDQFGSLAALDVGGASLPVNTELVSYIPYRGGYNSFEYISASDVINQKIDIKKLEGKIVLIGTSAAGLFDLQTTPFSNTYPGVEIHANLIAGILDGTIKDTPLWVQLVNFVAIVVLGALFALFLPWLKPLWSLLASGIGIAAVLGSNLWLYQAGVVFPLAGLLGLVTLLYLFNVAYGYFVESRSKRLMNGLFGQYVPPELVDEMAKNPANFNMEGQSRELTILFSDVRGFTTISESLDAKTLSEFINAFLTPFTKVIYNNQGTIDKYMGDCIMAFWGAPIQDADHARHGLISAFEMLTAMEVLNQEFIQKGWPPIKVGIGLNSGRVSVGNMGSEIRLAYTVMGDAVNLASRLEGITKEYGAAIIIGDETYKQLPDLIAREVDKVRVKGKDVAVTIYEPLGFEGQVSEHHLSALPLFKEALRSYREQRWDEAESQFTDLLKNHRDTGEVLYTLYLERIGLLRDNPPGDQWDGAFTFTKK